ncbi:MAG TPA: 16S rRNA (cytosine(1402)-N(4))-methyltransferase RsmH [Cytophagaceae bacterium]|jgi:16S rRNA (cytosine1402-N4)-methyltransferase|nr:16S rRNA (cytosine(1402)-N(4))-methyltransferase RsmH [Cytophagaceae bacterium]
MNYHVPVLLNESVAGLNIREGGIYADVTFGGGGHSAEILKKLKKGKLFAFDQDSDAKANADSLNNSSLIFVESNFRHLKRQLKMHGVKQIDGLLADLGVSSHQIDSPERGFSTRFEGELDMRMDRQADKTAQEVLNKYSEENLHKIFGMYGEVRNARTLAAEVIKGRARKSFRNISDLKIILQPLAPRGKENKYFAQVFQAIRIEVNDELKALEDLLEQSAEVIKKGGRLVVISYHSLEDRLVKNFINKGKFFGEIEKDVYGNFERPFKELNRKPVEASEEEVEKNKRARSAKLRIAEKI